MYKYEMHLHTTPCSGCGVSTGEEYVRAAKELGMSGFVITNHFYRGNSGIDRSLPWVDFVSAYEEDYLRTKEIGDKEDIDVLFGIESVFEPGKEALIYGITPQMLKNCPEQPNLTIRELSDWVHACGGFIVCAHPFRVASYIPDPDREPDPACFDAIEVYNHANSTPEANEKAVAFAKRENLPGTSGSDVHAVSQGRLGKAGLAFPRRIRDGKTLVAALKAGQYRLIVNGEIQEN